MMTTIPLFKNFSLDTNLAGKSVAFYPFVGLLLGVLIWILSIPTDYLFPTTLASILLFTIYTLSYGALHTDGLADTLDALLSWKKPEDAAEILKDPHIGAQGAVYVMLFMILKVSAFTQVPPFFFIAIPMLSRFGCAIAIKQFPYMKSGKMAKSQHSQFSKKDFWFASISIALIFPFTGLLGLPLLLIAALMPLFIGKKLEKRLLGLNGDSYGYIIEISELILLLLSVILLK